MTRWPFCTIPECDHARTPPRDETAQDDWQANWKAWISRDGRATCTCHPNETLSDGLSPFPCDEGQK